MPAIAHRSSCVNGRGSNVGSATDSAALSRLRRFLSGSPPESAAIVGELSGKGDIRDAAAGTLASTVS
jgi:hypothetical protein